MDSGGFLIGSGPLGPRWASLGLYPGAAAGRLQLTSVSGVSRKSLVVAPLGLGPVHHPSTTVNRTLCALLQHKDLVTGLVEKIRSENVRRMPTNIANSKSKKVRPPSSLVKTEAVRTPARRNPKACSSILTI